MQRRSGKAIVLFLITAAMAACKAAPQPAGVHSFQRTYASMGTELQLTAWTADEKQAEAAFAEVIQEMERLEALLSNWRSESETQQLNAAAGKHPVRIGSDLRDLLQTARQVSDWTGGKFDVTWGALSGLWKFDYQNQDGTIPEHSEIVRRRSLIDYHQLVLDEHEGTGFLKREGMVANLGGIGKGYAVDRARDILRRRGLRDFMIQFGGDMYVAGLNGNHPWRLGIQDPRGPANRIFAQVDLSDSTFSTSGDYARSFVKNGRRYHHIIDPTTGEPAQGCRSVTIMANSATIADGLSTGVFVLGPQTGMALVKQLPGVEAVIVSAKNEVIVSPGLKGRLTLLSSPTDAP